MATSRKTAKDPKTSAPKTSSARQPRPGAPDSPLGTMQDEEGEREAAATGGGTPTHDEIARRAYELYLERGGEHGRDADDWRRAEEELRHSR